MEQVAFLVTLGCLTGLTSLVLKDVVHGVQLPDDMSLLRRGPCCTLPLCSLGRLCPGCCACGAYLAAPSFGRDSKA